MPQALVAAQAVAPSSPASVAAASAALGVTDKGGFNCEARCFCAIGDHVWVGERSGVISVRCARTGAEVRMLDPVGSVSLFATAMVAVNGEMWIGASDGRLCVFDAATCALRVELTNVETEKRGEIFALCSEGASVYAAQSTFRVSEWDASRKLFVRSFVHGAPVRGVAANDEHLFSGDDVGAVHMWDRASGDLVASWKEGRSSVTCVLLEERTGDLWVARANGNIDVFVVADGARLRFGATLSDSLERLNSLLCVGGKVWGAGLDRYVYIWHGENRKLIGKVKTHRAFVFALGKLYTMETARVWSLSNDKSVHIYDGEGFFHPVQTETAVRQKAQLAAQAQTQELRAALAFAERQLALAREKVAQRDTDLERARADSEHHVIRIHALQHALLGKDEALSGTQGERSKLLEETGKLSQRVATLQAELNAVEAARTALRMEVTRTQEELSRAKSLATAQTSQASMIDTERLALMDDKGRALAVLTAREAEVASLTAQVRQLRDEASSRAVEAARHTSELDLVRKRTADVERARDAIEAQRRALHDANRRLEDTLILRDKELREQAAELARLTAANALRQESLSEAERRSQAEARQSERLQDTFVLKSHEYDVLHRERDGLAAALEHDRAQLTDARQSENRLRLQNEELQRQLESEKTAVAMLRDQYTIFQFVLSSRGELINAIWSLHGKLEQAGKGLRALDVGVRGIDPTKDKLALRREWSTNVVEKAQASVAAVAAVQRQTDYIIANYLSEYEKLHLGVSVAKFTPDAQRAPVVGDQLLLRLRDVTLNKQHAPSDKRPATLPAPHDPLRGSDHTLGLVSSANTFRNFSHTM